MAGESAEELARRQREKAARLLKSADLYEAGAVGERRTGAVLDALASYGYVALHDLAWPGRPRANIDHALVGPSGVYVIDSKNWSGRILVSQGTLMQNARRRDQAVAGCGEAALALASLLGRDVVPVLCFVREEEMNSRVHEVRVCTTSTLERMILSRPAILRMDEVHRTVAQLRAGVVAATDPARRAKVRDPRKVAKSKPRRRSFAAGRAVMALLFVLVFGGLMVSCLQTIPDAVDRALISPGAKADQVPSIRFGQVYVVQRTKVRVRIGKPVRTEPQRAGAYIEPGTRLVSVKVRLRNMGKSKWQPDGLVRFQGEDSAGNSTPPSMAGPVKSGPPLPEIRKAWPGKKIEGVLVFKVPAKLDLEAVTMSTNPFGAPLVAWSSLK